MKKISVYLNKNNKYEILIKYKLINYINIFSNIKNSNKIMFITNEFLFKKYFKYLLKNINNINYNYIIIPDGESSKSINTLYNIITTLLNYSYDRNSYLIAFGGGVITDITGFAASIYLRGIKYINIPTTLLSQIDASIGGKTGINHALGKNMIGSFYQPLSVIIDTKFLYTLSKKELISGISEIIKYSIIYDYNFFLWIEKNIENLLNLKKNILIYCIYKCCKLKSMIIKKDEKDYGIRSILNFGHTYGHAIESFVGYGNWTHGEAISAGMIMELKLSCLVNNFSEKSFNRIKKLIIKSNLPINGPENMKPKDYIFYMLKDKKNSNSLLNIVILSKIGKAKLVKNISINKIIESINLCKKYKF